MIDRQMEREEEDICERHSSGEIDLAQYNREMKELQRDYREMAENSAQEAYNDEMGRW